jgi:serine/threonine protein kinase
LDRLPDEVERGVLQILTLPPTQWHDEVEALCARNRQHTTAIREMLAAALSDPRWTTLAHALADDGAGHDKSGDEPDCPGRIGPYEVLTLLGRGGMGAVYLARHVELGRLVALKLIARGHLDHPRAHERFRREAHAVGRLDHPHICRLYEAGVHDGRPFMALQLVRGMALDAQIRSAAVASPDGTDGQSTDARLVARKPMTRRELDAILRYFEKVARALHVAHEAGVVHRDIKPGNLMVTPDGEPMILDFGLAHEAGERDVRLTATASPVGTPLYMAPEQVRQGRHPLDRRVDVYALGVTIYETLTLVPPYGASGIADAYESVLRVTPTGARTHNSALPPELDAVLACALEKDPARRYATALALAEDLRRVRDSEPITARRLGPLLRGRRWVRRHPLASAWMGLSTVALIVLGALLSYGHSVHATQLRTIADGYVVNGQSAMRIGAWDDAIERFEKASTLGCSDVAEAVLGQAEAHAELSELEDARETIELFERLSSNQRTRHQNARGSLLRAMLVVPGSKSSDDEPTAHLKQALERLQDPPRTSGEEATYQLATALLAETDVVAEGALQAALAADPGHRAAHRMLIVLWLLTGRPHLAGAGIQSVESLFVKDKLPAAVKSAVALLTETPHPGTCPDGPEGDTVTKAGAAVAMLRESMGGAISRVLTGELSEPLKWTSSFRLLFLLAGRIPMFKSVPVTPLWHERFRELREELLRVCARVALGDHDAFLELGDILPDPLFYAVPAFSHWWQESEDHLVMAAALAARAQTVRGITSAMPSVQRFVAALRVNSLVRLSELRGTTEPDLWREIENATQLPRLTELEFRSYAGYARAHGNQSIRDLVVARWITAFPDSVEARAALRG